MKLIEVIERASARLDQAGVSFGHGTSNAFDEAVWLALWQLKRGPIEDLDTDGPYPRAAEHLPSRSASRRASALVAMALRS